MHGKLPESSCSAEANVAPLASRMSAPQPILAPDGQPSADQYTNERRDRCGCAADKVHLGSPNTMPVREQFPRRSPDINQASPAITRPGAPALTARWFLWLCVFLSGSAEKRSIASLLTTALCNRALYGHLICTEWTYRPPARWSDFGKVGGGEGWSAPLPPKFSKR
jgi:hypothetical protein